MATNGRHICGCPEEGRLVFTGDDFLKQKSDPSQSFVPKLEKDLCETVPKNLRSWVNARYLKFLHSASKQENSNENQDLITNFFFNDTNQKLFEKFNALSFQDGHYKNYFIIIGWPLLLFVSGLLS